MCLECHSTGDGVIAGLQVLAALRERDATLKEICQDLVLYPQKLVMCLSGLASSGRRILRSRW
ncbi:hypothetical protein [Zoogloea sp.]|uniref:hypothetical protein n=1 Tax=Zoogloea sp. TaxID=49181 RepID=UPI003457D1AF